MAEISIQVLEPAKIMLPPYVNKVAFVNHSSPPRHNPDDTAGLSRKEIYILDTVINNQIFLGLRHGLNESPLFDLDSISIIQFRRNDTSNLLSRLSGDQLQEINSSEGAEAVISLEYYGIKDTLSLDELEFDYLATRRIFTTTVWRIYDLAQESMLDEYMVKDTADWFLVGEDRFTLIESLPEFINSIRYACYHSGLKYGQRISPTWYDVPRFYHTSGGREMRRAAKKAAMLDWQGASEIWKKLAYLEDEKTAAKASFNMALVCEMEDLLIPALDWSVKSYLIRQDEVTMEYIDQLKNRYEKQKVIKTQLPFLE